VKAVFSKNRFWELDCVRATVAIIIMVSHYVGGFYMDFPLARLGRQMLLVLSAYFATEILLRLKRDNESIGGAMKSFYVRRWLRLYPVYATVVLCLGLLLYAAGTPSLLQETPWHLLYLSNYYFFFQGEWSEVSTPWWTLSAIEQFYLVWPIIVLQWNRKTSLASAYALFAVGVASALLTNYFAPSPQTRVLTLNCLPYLSIGALLSLHQAAKRDEQKSSVTEFLLARPWWWVASFFVLWWVGREHPLIGIIGFVASALGFAGFVQRLLRNPTRREANRIVSVVAYFGRASFMIYLIHTGVAHIVRRAYFFAIGHGWLGDQSAAGHENRLLVANIVVTLALSALLHEWLEKPFIGLRSRAGVKKPVAQPAAELVAEPVGR
jgi:peptidoglycan/LPS O-acetylase OafA/YrhL